jgi:hypothetical protein
MVPEINQVITRPATHINAKKLPSKENSQKTETKNEN